MPNQLDRFLVACRLRRDSQNPAGITLASGGSGSGRSPHGRRRPASQSWSTWPISCERSVQARRTLADVSVSPRKMIVGGSCSVDLAGNRHDTCSRSRARAANERFPAAKPARGTLQVTSGRCRRSGASVQCANWERTASVCSSGWHASARGRTWRGHRRACHGSGCGPPGTGCDRPVRRRQEHCPLSAASSRRTAARSPPLGCSCPCLRRCRSSNHLGGRSKMKIDARLEFHRRGDGRSRTA